MKNGATTTAANKKVHAGAQMYLAAGEGERDKAPKIKSSLVSKEGHLFRGKTRYLLNKKKTEEEYIKLCYPRKRRHGKDKKEN